MRFSAALALFGATLACASPPLRPASAPTSAAPKRHGAHLLALPGAVPALTVAGAPREVVRGRVRWRLDDGGALRLREVVVDPTMMALAIPPWLGEGIALFGDDSVVIASSVGLRKVTRASLMGPSIGAHELWARARANGGDWVRLDLERGEAAFASPPISAPIVIPPPYLGRGFTAGPEFGSPTFAIAIVDLLGPVMTRDAGASWSPLGDGSATRIAREGGLAFASDTRAIPISQAGILGAPVEIAKSAAAIPDVASIRVEALGPFGITLPDGELLVADGPRLARVQLDPVRIVRVGRDDSLSSCELGPSKSALALAVCMRHEEGASFGGRIVAGSVVDGVSGPRLVIERSFPPASARFIASSGALVVAATCDGSPEKGSDLLTATQVCVRATDGTWSDLALVGSRRMVVPRADGGLVVVRDEGAGTELASWPRSATPVAKPARLSLKPPYRYPFALDEVESGRLVVWGKRDNELAAMHVRIGDALTVIDESPKAILTNGANVGIAGDRALIVANIPGKGEIKDRLEGSLTVDGGRSWSTDAFPEGLRPIEPSSTRVECGESGCRAFGWSRIGWQRELASADRLFDLDAIPRLSAAPSAPKRATTLTASCVRIAPTNTFDAYKAYGLALSSPAPANLLGLPSPKVGAGQVMVASSLAFGTVRGSVISIGPSSGSWGTSARSVVRFASDLDPPGVAHESAPFVAPFADRMYAGGLVSAFALGPGRIVMAVTSEGRTDVYRVEAGVVPRKIELAAAVTIVRIVSARELGGTLLLTGDGKKPDGAYGSLYMPTPFVALVDEKSVRAAFLAPGTVDELHLGATIDGSRGAFAIATFGSLPSWTGGTLHVLPLAPDARPGEGFASFSGATSDFAKPTVACTTNGAGWDRVETSWKAFALTIDKVPAPPIQASASVRTRVSSNGTCIDRFTVVRADAVFQLDTTTRRAIHVALDPESKTAHRDELSCAWGWE